MFTTGDYVSSTTSAVPFCVAAGFVLEGQTMELGCGHGSTDGLLDDSQQETGPSTIIGDGSKPGVSTQCSLTSQVGQPVGLLVPYANISLWNLLQDKSTNFHPELNQGPVACSLGKDIEKFTSGRVSLSFILHVPST